MHRILIGVIACGAVIIAGIGFAGSYAALRELALKKGFGTFSSLFPIGIDAGICVLLALDLLLTWTRIPLALLRQTAWLLTAATIAFNGAAAWPNPLGVGMHAVTPILFVVTVEAARHAIGRIADITADTHMEGIRPARWLLSPARTFLLWRRMKLWELRSYQQTITLEQRRLVYQTRLRSRYGRTWRRTAPAEALIPLRLTRYGIPLTRTIPSGRTAAGIEEPLLPPTPQITASPDSLAGVEPPAMPQQAEQPDHMTQPPDPAADTDKARTPPHAEPAQPGRTPRHPQVEATVHHAGPGKSTADKQLAGLTTVDRYYLAWTDLQNQHSHETLTSTRVAEQLSAYLATKGLNGRGGNPISPATLRRYLLPFRIYHLWAQQRQDHTTPSAEAIATQCATHGITAQYSQPITTDYITELTTDFERRWHALNHPHTS